MGTQHPIRKVVTPEIPDKLYFRIGDVARLCEVPAYVLRFWETEFPQLKPNKGGTGQRLYRKRDVEMALRIKSLLYDQGYTIPGARGVFKNEVKPRETVTPFESAASAPAAVASASSLAPEPAEPVPAPSVDRARLESRLRALRHEMQELAALLSAPAGSAPAPKPRTLRPRLVVEPPPLPARADSRLPKAAAPQPPVSKPDPRLPRLVETRQGDLFSAE
jgi:DNA-binding transcriptional MerR regulator